MALLITGSVCQTNKVLFSPHIHIHIALQVIGYSSNLTVFISPDTVGSYTCIVTVKGYKQIQASGQVYQRGAPVMVRGEGGGPRVQYGALGDTVQLICEGRARPQLTRHWLR